ncbi:DMT family transporter [Rossellomorea sp. H39__3]
MGRFQDQRDGIVGDLLALVACALVTGYLLFGQTIRKRLSLMTYTYIVYAMSAAVLFIYSVVKGDSFYPYAGEEWVYFLLLAVIPTLLGHTLFNWSLKWLSTSTISMAILFEPVGAAILAYWLYPRRFYSLKSSVQESFCSE